MDQFTNSELIKTLRIASDLNNDDIELAMLLIIAAERIERMHASLYVVR